MAHIINEVLLYCCGAAFVTGIVLAAASFLKLFRFLCKFFQKFTLRFFRENSNLRCYQLQDQEAANEQ
jgi:hypothetical protein